jgi:chromosome segregation ATPase
LNTSIITEKSVRKAQDKYLAEEIDRFTKQMQIIQDKVKLQIDEEGNILAEKTKQESQLKKLDENMTAVMDQTETLKLEFNDLKESINRGDVGSAGTNEETQAKINKLNTKVDDLEEASAKYANEIKAIGSKDKSDEDYITYATVDQVDGKMAALLEKLKNDN